MTSCARRKPIAPLAPLVNSSWINYFWWSLTVRCSLWEPQYMKNYIALLQKDNTQGTNWPTTVTNNLCLSRIKSIWMSLPTNTTHYSINSVHRCDIQRNHESWLLFLHQTWLWYVVRYCTWLYLSTEQTRLQITPISGSTASKRITARKLGNPNLLVQIFFTRGHKITSFPIKESHFSSSHNPKGILITKV